MDDASSFGPRPHPSVSGSLKLSPRSRTHLRLPIIRENRPGIQQTFFFLHGLVVSLQWSLLKLCGSAGEENTNGHSPLAHPLSAQ